MTNTEKIRLAGCGNRVRTREALFVANIEGQISESYIRGSDAYGRIIGVCLADGVDISAQMLSTGNSWAFTKYSLDYISLEDEAKTAGIGVWQAESQTLWVFRHERWEIDVHEAPEGCPTRAVFREMGTLHTP